MKVSLKSTARILPIHPTWTLMALSAVILMSSIHLPMEIFVVCTMHLWAKRLVRQYLLTDSNLLKACRGLGSGLLSSGLTLAITTISLDTSDMIKNFFDDYNDASDDAGRNDTQITYVNHPKLLEAGKSFYDSIHLNN